MNEDPPVAAPLLSIAAARAKVAAGVALEHGRLAPYCSHQNVVIDGEARKVECASCKADLDPLDVLDHLCREESRLLNSIKQQHANAAVLEAKAAFRCAHCGKLTRIMPGERHRAMKDAAESARVKE